MAICGCMPQEEKVVKLIAEKYPKLILFLVTHNIHNLASFIYGSLSKEI